MAICGPKLSACCMVLSLWGIIQLGLMGVFFYTHSLALAEDLPISFDTSIKDHGEAINKFNKDVDDAYEAVAINNWIAAGIYVVFFLISAQQFWANQRSTKV